MANLKHLNRLKRGVKQWNQWRLNHHISPDLNRADLGGMKLEGADLSLADLTESNLQSADLSGVDFDHAALHDANLRGANCTRADFLQAYLADADFTSADLTNADMTETDMSEIDFSFANLNGLNLDNAFIWGATFRNNDLTKVRNLHTLRHQGPSSIDLDTILRSEGKIPVEFLRGVGLPEDFIAYEEVMGCCDSAYASHRGFPVLPRERVFRKSSATAASGSQTESEYEYVIEVECFPPLRGISNSGISRQTEAEPCRRRNSEMRNYLESVEAAFHAYRKRARRSFGFWWDGKLESKTSAQKTQSVEFQRQVSKQMRELGRQAFIGPIIVELEFSASERNSAEVHSLAKHYLDLLHRPHPDSGVERKHLLFWDDSQIQYLTCIYNAAADESGMHIRARRLSDFFSDIALLRELETGGLESEDESWREELDTRDDSDDRELSEYEDFRKRRPVLEQRWGREQYERMEFIWKREAQLWLLRGRKPMLSELSAIFAPRFHRFKGHREFKRLIEATSSMVRSIYKNTFLSMDFGPRALAEGESSQFRDRVRAELNRAQGRNKLLFPLLAPCAVTILYLPPEKAIKVDLDNLARKFIVPGIHEILRPPATPRDFLEKISTGEGMDSRTTRMVERWRNAPKFHIAYYQIFCLPRIDKDPEKGNVRLLIHDGDSMKTSWKVLDVVLDKWADSMKRYRPRFWSR